MYIDTSPSQVSEYSRNAFIHIWPNHLQLQNLNSKQHSIKHPNDDVYSSGTIPVILGLTLATFCG